MANHEQAELWNEVVGDAWVDNAAAYDAQLEPFGRAVMDRLPLASGKRVLDLGCGTGETTLELAERVAPGSVLGVDLSARMLDAARARAADAGVDTVEFREVDVQTGDLGRGAFDVAFSRMGVMFFADPVAAFANVAGALLPGGRLGFVCFQDPSVNPIIVLPVLSVAEILALPPFGGPDDPSPFALADAERTTGILTSAGFVDVEVVAGPDHFEINGADDLPAIAERMLVQNPLTSPRLAAADEATRAAALDAVVQALEPHRSGDTLQLGAGTWVFTARTPG
jgi:SAM-dependent methyltransferase